MDNRRLQDRVALITGGGQGIGKAIARHFLKEGARVVIAEVDAEAGGETERELTPFGEIRFLATDVADERAVENSVSRTLTAFGGLDILVNNAAIAANKPLADLTLAEWNRVLAVNLTGAMLCARYAASHLARQQGCIINIASTRALMSEPHTEAYSASKGGLVALTHALAISLGPGVRVNCIEPGWIEVSDWKKSSSRQKPQLTAEDHAQHPAGRVGRPEDIAALAAFLASEEAGFITGACFVADGGMTRKMIYV